MRFITITFCALILLLAAGLARAQEAPKGWLGAGLADLTAEDAAALGWEAPRGAKVVKPVEGSPAEKAGIQAGDVVVTLDGVEIENIAAFVAAIGGRPPGAAVKLRLLRDGKEKVIGVTLAERPAAQEAPRAAGDGPLPMLDTGGHMAQIKGIAFTPDGRQLVSASEDKTIRVWDAATGKTVRTIRGESAPGAAGMMFAMALSPDSKWLAVGGYLQGAERSLRDAIRLYDFASGRLVALLKGHNGVISGLTFSPNGKHLISGSGLGDFSAIIWDVEKRQLLHRLRGHTAHIYAVGFTPDGQRAVTGSYDHDLRFWNVADGREIAHMRGHGDSVRSLAVMLDGTIASGDCSGEIRLWDGQTGKFSKTLAQQGTEVGSLSSGPDGRLLLSGNGAAHGPWPLHVFDIASGKQIMTYPDAGDTVFAAAISPDGRWAATGGKNDEIHVWELRTGERRPAPDGQPLALGGTGQSVWAVGFSADGRRIGWGNVWESDVTLGKNPLHHALTLPTEEEPLASPRALDAEAAGAFRRAAAAHGGWSLSHRKGSNSKEDAILDIKRDGRVVAFIERDTTNGLVHNTYSFTPDGETIISGGSKGILTAYDRAGKKLGDFIGHEGVVWTAAPSPDGRYLVSGSADQTVRLWNLKTRELLITLFQGSDGEWVMWTQQGFYAASGPGAELIGWQINHGPESAADYVTAAQLRKSLNRPDIVSRAIQLASSEAAVKEAHGASFKLSDLLAKPVPRLRIVSPAVNAALRGGKAEMEIALDATPDPVKLIRIQVNGVQVAEHMPEKGGGFAPGPLKFEAPLAKGRNEIRVTAVNDTGETPVDVAVTHDGEGGLDKRGVLYILAIGVDKYPALGSDLKYAGADAAAFADAMEKRAGPMHERVVKRVLFNAAAEAAPSWRRLFKRPATQGPDEPTAANILDALAMLRQARETDTVMVFVAGHGDNEGPNYRLLATDAARRPEGGFRPATVVPWVVFQEAIEGAKGRRILFLDTCHSGNAYNQRLSNDAYQANIVVYSAARWDQLANEDRALGGGHGLFTWAAVEGVNGAAGKGGEVTTAKLHRYLVERVRELVATLPHKSEQEPQYFRARDAGDYVLARGQ